MGGVKPGLVGSFKSETIGSSIWVAFILGVETGLSSLSLSFSLSPLADFDMLVLLFSDALSCAVLCLVLT